MKRFALALVASALLFGCSSFQQPKRVAVMDFETLTGSPKDKALGLAVPEYLSGYMVNAQKIYMIERQDMNRYLGARYGMDFQRLIYERWRDIGRRVDADYIIAGSVSRLENNLIVTARLFSVSKGQVVPGSAFSVSSARDSDLYPRMKQMAQWFVYQIQRRQPPPSAEEQQARADAQALAAAPPAAAERR